MMLNSRVSRTLLILVLAAPALAACGASGRASLGSRAGLVAGVAVAGPPGAAVGSALGAGIGAMSSKAKPLTVLGAAAGGVVGPTGASLGATGGQLVEGQLQKRQLAKDEAAAKTRLAAEEASAPTTAVAVDASAVEPAPVALNQETTVTPAPLAVPAP